MNTQDLEKVREIARSCRPEGESQDRKGQQLLKWWLPEPLKQLLIEEHQRPDGKKAGIAIVKYFNPCGLGTWYFSEYDPETGEFFGLCCLQFEELGYCSLDELRSLRLPYALFVERDYYFTPAPLSDVKGS